MHIKRLQGPEEKEKGIYYEFDADSTPIGEGGMGVVYKGFRVDEKTNIRTEVAIKALHEDLPDEVYARAEREASIQLRHENLVEMLGLISVFEPNKWGESVYHHYVISEYLYGVELSDMLVGHFLDTSDNHADDYAKQLYQEYTDAPEATSIKIMKSILSGVLALHDKGYIHRDIDPSNIMITRDGTIKLIDFGIAKNLNTLGSRDKLMTATGQFMGKAEYASPELVLGDVKHQNFTTDIYALGILFYRLLVGKLPFTGSQYEILQLQMKKKVPVGNITNKLLADIVKKATSKVQNNRYASVAEFRVALDYAECHKPKSKLPFVIGLLVCIAFLAFFLIIKWPAFQPKPVQNEFDVALAQLNSSVADSVKVGFNRMLKLAGQGNDRAKIEVGLTYFSLFPESTDIRSSLIRQRRTQLGLKKNSSAELQKSFNFVSSVKDASLLTPEVYYLLGVAGYYGEGDTQNVLRNFQKALQLIEADSTSVAHGYESTDLRKRLQINIKGILTNENTNE